MPGFRCAVCHRQLWKSSSYMSSSKAYKCRICKETVCIEHIYRRICQNCIKSLPPNIKISGSTRKILEGIAKEQGVDLNDKKFMPTHVLREKLVEHGEGTDKLIGYDKLKKLALKAELKRDYEKALEYFNRCLDLINKDTVRYRGREALYIMKKINSVREKIGYLPEDM
ncbi:MAG: hypothetical protein ACFFCS_01480 [Candidatus Hodarchaeota archaeon]